MCWLCILKWQWGHTRSYIRQQCSLVASVLSDEKPDGIDERYTVHKITKAIRPISLVLLLKEAHGTHFKDRRSERLDSFNIPVQN